MIEPKISCLSRIFFNEIFALSSFDVINCSILFYVSLNTFFIYEKKTKKPGAHFNSAPNCFALTLIRK